MMAAGRAINLARVHFDLIESDRRSSYLFSRTSFPKTVSHFSGCARMFPNCGKTRLTHGV